MTTTANTAPDGRTFESGGLVIFGPRNTRKTTRLARLWVDAYRRGTPMFLVVPANARHWAATIAHKLLPDVPGIATWARDYCVSAQDVVDGQIDGKVEVLNGLLIDEWGMLTAEQQAACERLPIAARVVRDYGPAPAARIVAPVRRRVSRDRSRQGSARPGAPTP